VTERADTSSSPSHLCRRPLIRWPFRYGRPVRLSTANSSSPRQRALWLRGPALAQPVAAPRAIAEAATRWPT